MALAFSSHPHHAEARREFGKADSAHPAAFCRATQQAFMRIITTPAVQKIYGSGVIANDAAWEKWELSLMVTPMPLQPQIRCQLVRRQALRPG